MLVIYNSLILTNKTYKTIKTRNTGIPYAKYKAKKYHVGTIWLPHGIKMRKNSASN